ncbi:putative MFS transporter [Zopfia rhizophila CBS 207.26]|uniref:Putative MFS transporter n=1 Tax=Zopfia rhizophila CBS 207.26 TaxID=1314779 RepID=A0A6A6D8L9_9PEZI|nr:putative MFS transporter [Zopfia rhizophila CBS 207.26]
MAASGTIRSHFRIFAMMIGLCAAVFLAALNQTVVATAIPTISNDLKSASGYAWISAAYLLANAVAAPIWSKLSDIWGRKLILLTAVALYFLFSIICAVSQSMQMLIIGRSFQGAAGGGLVQIVYATISDIFSMRARTFYLGLLQMMWATAGGLGPVVGGILAEYASWRWVFWINLPISFIAFFVLWAFLDVHNPKTKIIPGLQAVDWYGILSMLTFMVTLLLGLNFGGNMFTWSSPLVICLLVSGVAMAAVFILCERKARLPLVPLDLFGTISNVGALVIGFTHDWAVFSTEFYLPLYFQAVKSASPLQSGYLIIPITLTQAVVAIAAGFIVHKTGRYLELIWIGVTLLALGNGLYINLDVASPLGAIIAFQMVAATGAGLLFQSPLIALQALVPPQKTTAATATLGLVRNLSTSIAIVVGDVIFSSGMDSRSSDLLGKGLPENLADSFSGSSAGANAILVDTVSDRELQAAVRGAFADSLKGVWILCTCTSVCAVVASGFISRQVLSKVHVEVRTGLENM